ncbi:DUF2808 domain-containing protein [Iningainema tapete]|uniref:DUF2808 domain-containing protein n=1 Tax=Iningainema tapete BLCC-T55 TaxID=2748662 RepID=A0A8J6XNQ9_9CYAN|nr:DUF2808 domain-containing protein [Iningainema tapete]MBD2776411.1 DUF2808 domain-containing protein [Iningainema tapete BLCC-T55]
MRRLLSAIAVSGCLLAGIPAISWAQSLPGLTLFSGVKGENQLQYRLDFGGQINGWDRYRLRISNKKLRIAVAHFVISYPEYYKGSFDTKNVEVRVKDKKIPLSDVKWDKDNRVIEIFPAEAIPAGNNVEVVLSNVKNPASGGIFYFNCSVQSPGDVPLTRYIGTWIISIS